MQSKMLKSRNDNSIELCKILIDVLCELADERNFVACVSKSVYGGLLTGVSATIGGLLMGSAGLALGGSLGGIASSALFHNKYEKLGTVIQKMDENKKKELYNLLCEALPHLQQLLLTFGTAIIFKQDVCNIALNLATDYVERKFNVNVKPMKKLF